MINLMLLQNCQKLLLSCSRRKALNSQNQILRMGGAWRECLGVFGLLIAASRSSDLLLTLH